MDMGAVSTAAAMGTVLQNVQTTLLKRTMDDQASQAVELIDKMTPRQTAPSPYTFDVRA